MLQALGRLHPLLVHFPIALLVASMACSEPPPEPAPSVESPAPPGPPAVDYLSAIRPLLERRCFECHGERKRPKGNLRLSDLASVLARAPSEAAIVPGDPAASLLIQRLVLPADHEDRMPPEEPLPAEEIELLRRWIAEGARWTPVEARPAAEPSDAGAALDVERGLVLTEAERAARDAALERLRQRGARAQRLAREREEVEVDLGVAFPPCGEAELALLAGLEPCLVELSLARCAIGDEALARLAAFPRLRRLRLEHTAVGDEGLAALGSLAELESLNLFGTRVSDAGIGALRALPRLARLYAGDTALGDTALEELERARPGLVVER